MLRFAVVGTEQRYGPVLVSLDLQPLIGRDQILDLFAAAGRSVDEILDLNFISLAIDERVRLGSLASKAQDEVAKRHQDRAELHRALVAEVTVGDETADERCQVHQSSETAVETGRSLIGKQEVFGEV